jgi:hypothetical protein
MRIGPLTLFESDHGLVDPAAQMVVEAAALRDELRITESNSELLQERLAELELTLEDESGGWMRFGGVSGAQREFSRDGLRRIIWLARVAYLKNPLINRAVSVTAFYVWGGGVSMTAAHDEVDTVVQAFLDDTKNKTELTSHAARVMKEVELETAGNLIFVLFTNTATGRVRVRSIDVDEIAEIICNPEDATEPWYYKRVWGAQRLDFNNGSTLADQRITYYPDWRYKPDAGRRPTTIGANPVAWDTPVYHVAVGGLPRMKFGVPEVYSALNWARAAGEDLEDYATVRRALSRFAMTLTVKGGKSGIAAAKSKLNTTLANSSSLNNETNPPPLVGSTFIAGADGAKLESFKTSGAGLKADDSRRLWLMTASGVGLPETFFGDADVGNHATAKTLDRPTELRMQDRQTLWSHVLTEILDYVVLQAVKAPSGPLAALATVETDDEDGSERVVWGLDDGAKVKDGEDQPTIDGSVSVVFPDILEHDVVARVAAIVDAATLRGFAPAGTIDPETLAELLLQALGVEDSAKALAVLFPDDEEASDTLPLDPIRRREALKLDQDLGVVSTATAAEKLGYPPEEVGKATAEKAAKAPPPPAPPVPAPVPGGEPPKMPAVPGPAKAAK